MSLYLKYRPRDFANLIGQDYIRQTLINAVQRQKISHAYLFCGTRGTGKTSTARILAKAINCQNLQQNGEPCGQCLICEAIDQGRLVDLIEIDAASNRGIDEIRELKESIQFAPSQSKNKIYIIDEVHMLTKEAFNALLKTLEEPPTHVYFILATTEAHKIPETIISRCQRFNFRKIQNEDIVERLRYIAENENFSFEPKALELIAKSANGGMRDAIGLLEQMASEGELKHEYISQNMGLIGKQYIADFYTRLLKQNTTAALISVQQLVENSYNLVEFIREMLEFLREQMLQKIQNQENPDEVIKMIDIFTEAGQELKDSIIPQLPLEIAVIKICETEEKKIEENKKDKKGFFGNFGFGSEIEDNKEAVKKTPASSPSLEEEFYKTQKPAEPTSAVKEIPDFNLTAVKANWQKIIDAVPTAFVKMSLKSSEPIQAEGDLVQLAFKSKFHKEKLAEISSKNEILIALEKIFEQPIKIELVDLKVQLEPTSFKKQNKNKQKTPTANEMAEEIFNFID